MGGLGYLVSDTDFKSDGGFGMFEKNRHVFVHIEYHSEGINYLPSSMG